MKIRRARVMFSNRANFDAELAVTQAELHRGLRGRVTPSPMLFVFSAETSWEMTMSGVPFPLDMVMLDSAGLVVGLIQAGARLPGPFTAGPGVNYRYVLELPHGWIEGFGLRRGLRAAVVPMTH